MEQATAHLIRFEVKKEVYSWTTVDDILFVRSADHYTKILVFANNKNIWTIRKGTIKGLLKEFPASTFIRLNRFYLINQKHFSYIDAEKNVIYLKDGFQIPLTYRVSKFIIDIMKTTRI